MIDLLRSVLAEAGDHAALLLLLVLLFAAIDAAFGLGAILPGETGVVLGAIALSDRIELVALAVLAAALGAFVGDHIGFAVGRAFGPRLGETRLIHRLGRDRWDTARAYVAKRFWAVIVARLLPGVRTFVAAAAGASAMPYLRFAAACGVAAIFWATIWVVGSAMLGNALLDLVDRFTLPSLIVFTFAVAGVLLFRRQRKRNQA